MPSSSSRPLQAFSSRQSSTLLHAHHRRSLVPPSLSTAALTVSICFQLLLLLRPTPAASLLASTLPLFTSSFSYSSSASHVNHSASSSSSQTPALQSADLTSPPSSCLPCLHGYCPLFSTLTCCLSSSCHDTPFASFTKLLLTDVFHRCSFVFFSLRQAWRHCFPTSASPAAKPRQLVAFSC